MTKRAENKTEWYKRHYEKIANVYRCHPDMVQYVSAKYHFQGFSRENLITHCETKFVQYPYTHSHKRYFYLAVVIWLRTINNKQFEAMVRQPVLPDYLLEIEKIHVRKNGDLHEERQQTQETPATIQTDQKILDTSKKVVGVETKKD